MTAAIALFNVAQGIRQIHEDHGPLATRVLTWRHSVLTIPAPEVQETAEAEFGCYGYVIAGSATLHIPGNTALSLRAGQYFSAPAPLSLIGGEGVVSVRAGFTPLITIGGPIEDTGRLRYIDGCSDTVLIAPPVKGDPCLNLLHIPRGTKQTMHSHPSLRVGVITSGSGICNTPTGPHAMMPGSIFLLTPDCPHAFETTSHSMSCVVYHPDSDSGPTHADHPMLSKTIIEGVSARDLRRNDLV